MRMMVKVFDLVFNTCGILKVTQKSRHGFDSFLRA